MPSPAKTPSAAPESEIVWVVNRRACLVQLSRDDQAVRTQARAQEALATINANRATSGMPPLIAESTEVAPRLVLPPGINYLIVGPDEVRLRASLDPEHPLSIVKAESPGGEWADSAAPAPPGGVELERIADPSRLSMRDAIDVVKVTGDRRALRMWAELDQRPAIRRAIEARLLVGKEARQEAAAESERAKRVVSGLMEPAQR